MPDEPSKQKEPLSKPWIEKVQIINSVAAAIVCDLVLETLFLFVKWYFRVVLGDPIPSLIVSLMHIIGVVAVVAPTLLYHYEDFTRAGRALKASHKANHQKVLAEYQEQQNVIDTETHTDGE